MLRDSLLPLVRPSEDLRLVTDKTAKNKPWVDHEPRSAHSRAVKKVCVDLEPRSAHGHAVNELGGSRVLPANRKNKQKKLLDECVVRYSGQISTDIQFRPNLNNRELKDDFQSVLRSLSPQCL